MVPESSPLVGSGPLRLGETTDVSVIKTTTLKLAQKPFGTTAAATGLVGFATPFGGADTIETELGTIKSKNPQEAHHKRNIGIIFSFCSIISCLHISIHYLEKNPKSIEKSRHSHAFT